MRFYVRISEGGYLLPSVTSPIYSRLGPLILFPNHQASFKLRRAQNIQAIEIIITSIKKISAIKQPINVVSTPRSQIPNLDSS